MGITIPKSELGDKKEGDFINLNFMEADSERIAVMGCESEILEKLNSIELKLEELLKKSKYVDINLESVENIANAVVEKIRKGS